MLKTHRDPYGYKKLLVYKKAEELQTECRKMTSLFPKTKTMIDLADQMDRSARSGKQNIVEGWKRNTTKEYFDFLGFSLAAIAELEEDCGDIWRGVYPEILRNEGGPFQPFSVPFDIEKLRFYPLDPTLPPIVQLKLRCKELNHLITQLQNSLEQKMGAEHTFKVSDKILLMKRKEKSDDDLLKKLLEERGLETLENGQVVQKGEKGK